MAKAITKTESPKLVRAHARGLHISPRKMRLLTNLVKQMPLEDAVIQLQFTNKKASGMLIKLLRSASANAENNFSLKSENLFIKSITCDMGQTMKRYMPRARGSAFVIRRKLCNVNVVLEERARKKGKASRFAVMNMKKKAEEVNEQMDVRTLEEETGSVDTKAKGSAPQINKSSEQIKMNRQAQKRRMFNRKTGE